VDSLNRTVVRSPHDIGPAKFKNEHNLNENACPGYPDKARARKTKEKLRLSLSWLPMELWTHIFPMKPLPQDLTKL